MEARTDGELTTGSQYFLKLDKKSEVTWMSHLVLTVWSSFIVNSRTFKA